MCMRRVKVALAGLGSVSQRGILPHLACADAQERVETVACVDPVPGRAEETAHRFGWREAYTDYAEMVRRADVEAVLLATPIPLHHPQAVAAFAAGKHVYVQKAMATTLAEADAVVSAAERAGRKLVASPGQMLSVVFQRVRGLLQAGAIGRVYWAFSDTAGGGHEGESFRRGADVLSNVNPTWYYRPGGGPMYDMGVYALQALTGILGPVRRVTGMSGIGLPFRQWKDERIEVEMDDNTALLLDFGDSRFAMLGAHNCGGPPAIGFSRIFVGGTEGYVDTGRGAIEIGARAPLPAALLDGLQAVGGDGQPLPAGERPSGPLRLRPIARLPHVTEEHARIPESHVYADIMHLIDCIADDRDPVASGAHARHVVEVMEKGYAASRSGQTQAVTTAF